MLRTIKRSLASLVFLLASVVSGGSAAELVTNGGFEDPLITGPQYDYETSLPGWIVFSPPPHNGVVLFDADYRPVGAGLQSLQLEWPDDYIEQSIATTPGQNYVLSFLLSAYDAAGGILEVEIGGVAVPLSPYAGTSASYVSHSVVFTATAASTLLHFENGGPLPSGTYPHLDNISVQVIPEPTPLALLGLGLAGLAFARRKP